MLRILELVWLTIAVLGAMFTAYSFFDERYERYDSMWFGIISVVAVGMFFVRRKQRLMREKQQ